MVAKLVLPQGLQPQFSFALVGDGLYPIEGKVDYRGRYPSWRSRPSAGRDPPYFSRYMNWSAIRSRSIFKQGGRRIEMRFTPNDLGRVAFQDTHLPITDQVALRSNASARRSSSASADRGYNQPMDN